MTIALRCWHSGRSLCGAQTGFARPKRPQFRPAALRLKPPSRTYYPVMKIRRLLSDSVTPLALADTVEDALGTLMEQSTRHLPVVGEQGELAGLISEEQLLEALDSETAIGSLLRGRPVSAGPDEHVFDATRVMVEHNLSVLPVTGDASHYLGAVRRHDLFDAFAQMLSMQEPGAILALEVAPRDYSLAQLVHLIEQSDVKVLSVTSEPPESETGPTRVTVKLNTTDTARVRHMLEHHGYDIVASFGEQDGEILERVQEFLRYLEV